MNLLCLAKLVCWRIAVYICSGLNFTDLMVRQGAIDNPPKVPFVMGFECAGEVQAIGETVDDLKVSRHHTCVRYQEHEHQLRVDAMYIYESSFH